jgi:hypothetical protein
MFHPILNLLKASKSCSKAVRIGSGILHKSLGTVARSVLWLTMGWTIGVQFVALDLDWLWGSIYPPPGVKQPV